MLHEKGLDEIVCRKLSLQTRTPVSVGLREWRAMCGRMDKARKTVAIALVGKYVALRDAYLSVAEALRHAGYENGVRVEIDWVDAQDLDAENAADRLGGAAGILVPGGFGGRGIEGMVCAARYAREHLTPYLGICLGMQIAVIEYARAKAGLPGANSREFVPGGSACVIDLMPDQHGDIPKGGTMRLGAYPCEMLAGSKLQQAYGETTVWERHRHRYEASNEYRQALGAAGLVFSGLSPDGRLAEAVELPDHPFYIGVQYHPEFKSRPNRAHPLFQSFVAAAVERGNANA